MPKIKITDRFIYILLIPLILLLFVLAAGFSLRPAMDLIKFELGDKSGLKLAFETVDPRIKSISSDPENDLVIRLEVRDKDGLPVAGAGFRIDALNKNAVITPSKRPHRLRRELSDHIQAPGNACRSIRGRKGKGNFNSQYFRLNC